MQNVASQPRMGHSSAPMPVRAEPQRVKKQPSRKRVHDAEVLTKLYTVETIANIQIMLAILATYIPGMTPYP